ncbi:MAG: prepilin-type N-terminal cleavage/methylation domain-containing protein [Planctomycetota bacterium]|nr:prepilin-type N-terminal cleavage/methylation domain-containing protein [Planctomycetota bacterium]
MIRSSRPRGFTLVELLITVAIIGVLAAMIAPALAGALREADRVVCASNLRQVGLALRTYLKDHDGWCFALYDPPGPDDTGRTWYFGWEPNGSPARGEGNRILDRSKAKLAPYLGDTEGLACPAVPFRGPYKPKFQGTPWTYGINRYLASHPSPGRGNVNGNGNAHFSLFIGRDSSRTVVFADAAQVVTHLAPASPSRPMVECFPYVEPERRYIQFRHGGRANVLFADWHVEACEPAAGAIDPRLPEAMIGHLDPERFLYRPRGGR